jgi:hypothetical protein
MFETLVEVFVDSLTAYSALGLLFALWFVWKGVERLDSQARGARLGFRLLILPGIAAFWPLFLARWVRGVSEPPLEQNSHRRASAQ